MCFHQICGLWSVHLTPQVKVNTDSACVSADTMSVWKNKESTNVHGCPQEALSCWAGHYLQSNEKAFLELLLPLRPRLRGLEPADRNAPFLGQEHTEGRLWSEELIFVETFARSYKSVRCVAGLPLTLEQRTKSILVSHAEENTEDAETTGC